MSIIAPLAQDVDDPSRRSVPEVFASASVAKSPPRSDLCAPVQRGRGATINPGPRYASQTAHPFDDGWDTLAEAYARAPARATTLLRDTSRSAISWNTSPDIGFDRSVNPYRGCEHGCVYCYARPTHAWLGYSPGLDFETKLVFKPEVAALLEQELRRRGYTPRPMALGTNTDPYQPIERTLKLTRAVLEVLQRFNHPLTIVTKSAGVLRDLDILAPMATIGLARVYLSVTTLDARLARRMEPRAATPERRLQAVAALNKAGVPTGVLAAPMIPGLNDCELEAILARARDAGARYVGYVLLRLPLELGQIFEDWLLQHYPDRARHVLSLIRQTREGKLNDARFHERFTGAGPYADLLAQRFRRAARDFAKPPPLDLSRFRVPPMAGAAEQFSLAL
jgi:DNA repair photolyase